MRNIDIDIDIAISISAAFMLLLGVVKMLDLEADVIVLGVLWPSADLCRMFNTKGELWLEVEGISIIGSIIDRDEH